LLYHYTLEIPFYIFVKYKKKTAKLFTEFYEGHK